MFGPGLPICAVQLLLGKTVILVAVTISFILMTFLRFVPSLSLPAAIFCRCNGLYVLFPTDTKSCRVGKMLSSNGFFENGTHNKWRRVRIGAAGSFFLPS